MIDWVSAVLPCLHTPINGGVVFKVDLDGTIAWQTRCAVSVSGSHESTFQIRSFGGNGEGVATHLHISGNPSKFLQGHNLFGSDDLRLLVNDTFLRLVAILNLSPSRDELDMVEAGQYRLIRVDINYSYELPTRADVRNWLRAAEYSSKTRHGRPTFKGSTLYWGKNSKRWSIKAYSKGDEITVQDHRLPDCFTDTGLTPWADNKLRIEVTLRSKELDEIHLSSAYQWDIETPRALFLKYIERLDMSAQLPLSNNQLNQLPQRLRATYILWKDGHNLREALPPRTYYRHRKELLERNINIDLRCNAPEKTNVVPLLRVLEAIPVQVPQWAVQQGLVHHSVHRKLLQAVA